MCLCKGTGKSYWQWGKVKEVVRFVSFLMTFKGRRWIDLVVVAGRNEWSN